MLNDLEQKIVDEHKEWGFGYLQWGCMRYPELINQINNKLLYPKDQELHLLNIRMDEKRLAFDDIYRELSELKENPLKVETRAWILLSPFIGNHVDEFSKYCQRYNAHNVNKKDLLDQLNLGLNLVSKWNIISNSYKEKYQKQWDKVAEKEQLVKDLISELEKC